MTVRPREMATGTKNPDAGEYKLESVKGAIVSVPPDGVGEKRCPLWVQLPGGGIPARQMMDWVRPSADKHGMLLLTVTRYETKTIDKALKEVLEKFAIEPEKIAIAGRCASGAAGMRFGIDNLDVFSRIISISGGVPINGMDPENKTAEFLLDRGFLEAPGCFKAARGLRKKDHPVKVVLALRGHEHQMEDYDYVGHWLRESWTKPPDARTAPSVVADPLPELTTDVLAQMSAFWTSFAKEPVEIRQIARRDLLREVIVPVGEERPVVWMTDMVALAAKHSSVADAFKKAGLTAKQHEAYRVALISAQVLRSVKKEGGTVEEDSVMAKNVAFLDEHQEELKYLRWAGIEQPDKIRRVDATATIQHPKQAEAMGPMGIWRTP
ncbi:MAG: hypothetical protein HY716_04280 [Planctomycetes bacterium]|nr:hypothetical protein [Planctomycetota bacterium]